MTIQSLHIEGALSKDSLHVVVFDEAEFKLMNVYFLVDFKLSVEEYRFSLS